MGLKGGIGCLLALFAGLLWLESTVGEAYILRYSREVSKCIINTRHWIILDAGQVFFLVVRGVLFPFLYNREFNNLTVD